jgi:ketosteroid isomerase-like protein
MFFSPVCAATFTLDSPRMTLRPRLWSGLVGAAALAGTAVVAGGWTAHELPHAPVRVHLDSASPSDDSSSAAGTVHAFHDALVRGDSAVALALLAPDVAILESGDVETLSAYRAHHLPADIAYARAVPSTSSPLHVTVQGDVAWVVSTSETKGRFRGRSINSVGAELMILSRTSGRWRIRAIHWSSHRRAA